MTTVQLILACLASTSLAAAVVTVMLGYDRMALVALVAWAVFVSFALLDRTVRDE